MRWLWFVVFVVFAAGVGAFAIMNRDLVPINYPDETFSVKSVHLPMALLIGGVYFLGMLTGWTVVGFLKRTVQHVTERRVS